MSRFITNTTYPIIGNANEYMFYKKMVSIHSEDRDVLKYPNASYFEIDLPQDYLNVSSVTLGNYNFPMCCNTFSLSQHNIFFIFQLANYPALPGSINNTEFIINITEGVYVSVQMATELTNKMNEAVNTCIQQYITDNSLNSADYPTYNDFVVAYNAVSQTLWFGNKSSCFFILNESSLYKNETLQSNVVYPDNIQTFINWGLPSYLGFFRSNASAIISTIVPRFYYGDAINTGDNGYWLAPATNTGNLYYLEAPRKLNVTGDYYFYMDIQLLNNIDEIVPFSTTAIRKEVSTSQSNGINNSAFAKIPTAITEQQNSQWFNNTANKVFYPVAERIRRLRLKLRFHDGRLVNFDNFNYSFNLIFTQLVPQNLRNAAVIDPTQSQGFNHQFGALTANPLNY